MFTFLTSCMIIALKAFIGSILWGVFAFIGICICTLLAFFVSRIVIYIKDEKGV